MSEPHRFGRFEVESTLGKGGMGVVYRAIDPVLDRPVAVKAIEIHPRLSDAVVEELEQRFQNEARAAAKLSHPNLVTIYDAGREGDTLYIAMELVEGEGLDDILAQGRVLTYKEIADLTLQLASALDYAHGQGIVHRDIKPANVLVERGGRPRIADFGVARQATSNLTATGTIVGTPAYMSPEQITGHEVTGAADQFCLGVLVYELLTRRQPFEGQGATTVLYKIVHETPERPMVLEADLPSEIDGVIMRALEKNPENRYPTCRDFAGAVREALGAAPADAVLSLTASAAAGPPTAPRAGSPAESGSTADSGKGTRVSATGDEASRAAAGEARDRGAGAPDGRWRTRAGWIGAGALLVVAVVAWIVLSDGGMPASAPEKTPPPVTGDERPQARGVYRIETRPADSRVIFDERLLEGESPHEVELSPEEQYSVRVERDGYEAVGWSFSLADLTAEQRRTRELFFPLTASAGPGDEVVDEEELPPVDPVRIRGQVEAPEVLERTEPEHPDWARRQGLPVYVVLELVIDEEGRVRDARPLGREVHPSLAELAIAAVRQWRFAPARNREDGDPVAAYFNVSVQFREPEEGS